MKTRANLSQDAYDAAVNAALDCLNKGNDSEAAEHAQAAFALRPDDAEALSLYGLCLISGADTREAGFTHLRRALELEPEDPHWQFHLAQGLTKAERHADAEPYYAAAAEMSGGHAGMLMGWAGALVRAGRPTDASQVYARVIQKNPNNTKAWFAAYEALTAAGDNINAVYAFEKAHPAEARSDTATAQLADLNIALGRYEKAQVFNDSLRAKNESDPDVGLRAANLMRWNGQLEAAKALQATLWADNKTHAGLSAALLQDGDDAALEAATTIANDEQQPMDARRRCAFALCSFADKSGESGAAWDWAVLANALYPADEETHDKEDVGAALDGLRALLDKAVMAYQLMPEAEAGEDTGGDTGATKMIYIIGPPRSGGSLLQTILTRHSGARSVGERGALLSSIAQLLDDPETLAAQLGALAKTDIAGMTRAAGLAAYFVDKTPHNFLIAGLLEKVHAGAVFAAPHRDIADMAVSLYFHEFGKEFAYARSLQDIKDYLDFHEAALVRWRELGVKIIAHNHDRFTEDTQSRGAALCEQLGLSWSDDMLEAVAEDGTMKDGAIRTFSARQVRGGVSATFKGRGKRYEAQLAAAGVSF